jgi:hypothetical protein
MSVAFHLAQVERAFTKRVARSTKNANRRRRPFPEDHAAFPVARLGAFLEVS